MGFGRHGACRLLAKQAYRLGIGTFTSLMLLITVQGSAIGEPIQFGSNGARVGQFNNPVGAAIDQLSGSLYVADRNNQRIDKFASNGEFQLAWGWGVSERPEDRKAELQKCAAICFEGTQGTGSGQFSFPRGIAVDNSINLLDASVGDVYVVDLENSRVEKFGPSGEFLLMFGGKVNEATGENVCKSGEECGPGRPGTGTGEFTWPNNGGNFISVDSMGTVYVGDTGRVQEFSSEGTYESQIITEANSQTFAMAVDGGGNIYLRRSGSNGISEYNSAGTLISDSGIDPEGRPIGIAFDSSNDVFVDDEVEGGHIIEFDSSGTELANFDLGNGAGVGGIAWSELRKELYAVSQTHIRTVSVPPPGPLVASISESATTSPATSIALSGAINPEGDATEYFFEYGLTASYGNKAPMPANTLGASFNNEVLQSVELIGLTPRTSYHYRLVAKDELGHTTTSPDKEFQTAPAVLIASESVSKVADSSATFYTELNTLGVAAQYKIEYGKTTSYGHTAEESSLDSGFATVNRSFHLQGLESNTSYHYRVVASDVLAGIPYEVQGQDKEFKTQVTSNPPGLLNDRDWELVSPIDKHGALVFGLNESTLAQASSDGQSLLYAAGSSTEDEPQGFRGRSQIFSTRGTQGWSSEDIALPHDSATGLKFGQPTEYQYASSDLSTELVEPQGQDSTLLSGLASERTPYLRRNSLCPEVGATASEVVNSSCYSPLVTGFGPFSNVPAGVKFGGDPSVPGQTEGLVHFVDSTPDTHYAVISTVGQEGLNLTSTSTPEGGLYEWSYGSPPASQLQLISALPGKNEIAANNHPVLGFRFVGSDTRHAISEDGSRVFWSERQGGSTGGGHLYMRDLVKKETIQLDQVQPDETLQGSAEPVFETASSDGSKAFFLDRQPLTSRSAVNAGADLYECEVMEDKGSDKCKLTDLTPEVGGEAANVQGVVIGTSLDGDYLYFVASGKLSSAGNPAGENPVAGGRNLYLLHYRSESGSTEWESPRFIAELSADDETDYAAENESGLNIASLLRSLTAKVSPNGRYLAFMSNRSLTGYDNADIRSGEPDEEVFLYDAPSGHIVCASCNPTMGRPIGTKLENKPRLIDYPPSSQAGIAANIPGWTDIEIESALVQSRYLKDDGQLFFNSSDALVPTDVNGNADVYEYEPAGLGSCSDGSSRFDGQSDGCISLISSGLSADESAFLEASESGDDVFFLSAESLVSQDVDSAYDIYDAHTCSESAPCAVFTRAPHVCESATECRSASSTSLPGVLNAPASEGFSGSGNLIPSKLAAKRKRARKSLTRAQKLSNALDVCHKKRGIRRRSTCERQARSRYGANNHHRTGKKTRGTK